MRIIVSARLKPSQINYKIIPLTKVEQVEMVYLLRKEKGPPIPKVEYLILPKICKYRFFNILITPLILSYYALRKRVSLIITYNFLPHGFFGFIASRFTGIPFNYSQIDTNTIDIISRKGFFGKALLYMISKAFFINVPGKKSKQFYSNLGLNPDKIHLLHSTVDTNYFNADGTAIKDFDLLYIGVLEPRKRVDLIIDALFKLKEKDYIFAIVGEGSERHRLVQKVADLNLKEKVLFFGHQKEVKGFFNKSKCFILTSKIEGIPCAMLEAMACKLISIVTDVADISDVVNEKNGFLLSPDPSADEISRPIDFALTNYDKLNDMRLNARNTIVSGHSYDSATSKWTFVLSSLNISL
jgi:glycosyltransferase involved in cell wall biosynthesis